MKKILSFVICWILILTAAAAAPAADVVLRGGKIVTVDSDFRIVEAMAVQDGRIVALGTDEQLASRVDASTRVVDLQGRMVLPGLIDSHVHPSGASQYEANHEIPPMETIDDVLTYLRGRAEVVPKGEWIVLQQVFITRPWGTSTIYGIIDPRYRGMQYIDDDRLEALIRSTTRRGLAFTAHCQGDAAVESLVAAYGRVNKDLRIEPTRSSITHSSFMSEKAIAGAAKIGVAVDLQ